MSNNQILFLAMRYAELCLREKRTELSQEEALERITIRERLNKSHEEILEIAKSTIASD